MSLTGRIVKQSHELYQVRTETAEITARVSGRLSYQLQDNMDYPAVGDYVELHWDGQEESTAVIDRLVPRKSVLLRKDPYGTPSQVIAANVDYAFFCMSLNQNFNLRRLERYIAIILGAEIQPVVVLTKADLCKNPKSYVEQILLENPTLSIICCSVHTGEGIDKVRELITPETTAVFIGSSGVGKSTLINELLGFQHFVTQGIRESDDRGRHTTTHRELLTLPNGGTIIDTPGMRALGLDISNVDGTFSEIAELAQGCKFNDCTHTHEPGCAVIQAVKDGLLSAERLENYRKLHVEEKHRKRYWRRHGRG